MKATRWFLVWGFLALAMPGWGAGVWIDSSQVTLSNTGATVINARFRASAGGVDQLMADGGGTNATSGTTLEHNLGATAAISSREYAFTVEHRVGQGMIFRLVENQSSPQTWLLAYGANFDPVLPIGPTTTVATQGTLGGVAATTMPQFNSLRLEVQASEAHPAPPPEEASVSGLYFSSPTLAVLDGAWSSMTMTPTTPGHASGEVVDGMPVTVPTGIGYQRLVAEDSLTAHDWVLGGMVRLQRSGGGDGESVRLVIYGQQVTAAFPSLNPTPEPSVVAMLAMGAALAWRRRRGRQGMPVSLPGI